ncbi:MAG TPA: hypothetical protein P5248_00275, partial [Bacteroidales bacterium]|nr:hypothetical protein [Bacteroidales bacterium]
MGNQASSINHQPSGCHPSCPACPHRSWAEEDSLAQKQGFLEKALEPWKEVLNPVVSVQGTARWGYRRQAVLHTQWEEGWRYGLRKRDDLIPIPDCPVHHPQLNEAIRLMASTLPPPPSFPFAFFVVSDAQMVLVIKSGDLPSYPMFNEKLMQDLTACGIKGLWLHLHPSAGKRVFGQGGWHLVWGEPRSRDANGLWYGPASFQQLIPQLYQASLDRAQEFLAPGPDTAVTDLYCGTGTSMQRWIQAGAAVAGVEWSGEAVECARENVGGALVLRGLCRQRLPQLTQWWREAKEEGRRPLLYVNPPRTGLEHEVTAWITREYRPQRIAYLSCSAG